MVKRALFPTFIFAVLLFFSLWVLSGRDLRTGNIWFEYYTVITEEPELAENWLLKSQIPFASYNHSQVSFNAVPEMESIALSQVFNRFDSEDPRLDPYMKKVHQLFGGEKGNLSMDLLYIPREAIPFISLNWNLNNLYKGTDRFWAISGFEGFSYFYPLLILLFFAIATAFINRKHFLTWCGALCAWIPPVLIGGYPALLGAFVCLFLSLGRRKVFIPLLATILSFVTSLFLSQADVSIGELLLYLGPLLLSIQILPKDPAPQKAVKNVRKRIKLRLGKPDHKIFEPVSILGSAVKPEKQSYADKHLLKIAVWIFFLPTLIMVFFDKGADTFHLPLPSQTADSQWTLEDAEEIFNRGYAVSAGDYLTHLAFQEGFLYRRNWTYPNRETPLIFPVYETLDKGYSKSYEVMESYDENWFDERISDLNMSNPAALLFSTDGPFFVEKKPDQPIIHSFPLLKISFSMLLLWLLIFSDSKKSINTSIIARKKLLRRNEQVA